MNSFLEEQLKKTKQVTFYNEDNIPISKDELKDQNILIIKSKDFKPKEYLFTFESYLVNPFEGFDFHIKFNKGNNIPLKVMQGTILKTVGKMYYIKVRGYYYQTDRCNHCFKSIKCNSICIDCLKKFNINDVEDIIWEGFIPIKSCKIEEI